MLEILRRNTVYFNELKLYNPEILYKNFILAITKSDMLDDELVEMLKSDLPEDIPTVFISSVAGKGLAELKDIIWEQLNNY